MSVVCEVRHAYLANFALCEANPTHVALEDEIDDKCVGNCDRQHDQPSPQNMNDSVDSGAAASAIVMVNGIT